MDIVDNFNLFTGGSVRPNSHVRIRRRPAPSTPSTPSKASGAGDLKTDRLRTAPVEGGVGVGVISGDIGSSFGS